MEHKFTKISVDEANEIIKRLSSKVTVTTRSKTNPVGDKVFINIDPIEAKKNIENKNNNK